ncbi:hypothetical protein barba126A_phanotate157 [Rheinheimera phage vB_RspM_barba_12-6A]|uniref:Uncharacterized protein n=31 Tax=Barbavirus barba18A TaxID=2734090 RepID=A0A7G9VS17_9CAUD|nr:hypothetical protein barba13A_phanotate104 [Rheinheimera phage vB_RspM_barba_1-3A]QNO01548.1 hypothetical protein barba108A_phanotate37 [Rheinheimera phage vB_RspM_barba_10-8A]QNO01675.1 hypothetical protein barba108B_phanotate4 [Rheinheimera phage vB_RspM_barba_10-8B]QNO01868.1 hypothetical protein barba108D_phanotate37 [Rheinheimera phage vB_RspM_barba_10-8D]QNO02100.1 hypothetical protein barba109A_phanotate108 [Rheinheimera phage vB_RspM_barba_10-9A]QNO02266.1 hypothetical protein barba
MTSATALSNSFLSADAFSSTMTFFLFVSTSFSNDLFFADKYFNIPTKNNPAAAIAP